MNEKFTNSNGSETVAGKLNQVVEHTHVNSQFVAELETKLRNARRPKTSRLAALFRQVSPVVRWVALMILLGLVLSLSIKTLIPAPQPAEPSTASPQSVEVTATPGDTNTTPPPSGKTLDYDGTQLILDVPFPVEPAQANVYTAFRTQPASAEYARALAAQFGIEGEVYTDARMSREPEGPPLIITDGKQQLLIYAENDYIYTSDLVKASRPYMTFAHDNAETTIREYLQAHGFDFNFQVEAEGGKYGGYILQQLSPDGLPMESDTQGSTRVTLDEDGNILDVHISLITYEPAALGSFGILTAEEALTLMVGETFPIGSTESGGSVPDPNREPPQFWYRQYPDNQTITVYGNVLSYPAVDSNVPSIIFMDDVPVTGNTNGMDALNDYAFVQVTGQFVTENGVRKLNVETWDQDVQKTCVSGSAHRAGDQIIVTNEAENVSEYTLVDPPADLPLDTRSILPDSQLVSCGVVVDDQFHWINITYYSDPSQMGGGGGGGGGGIFYELNLSGTPVPFPTATPIQPSAYTPEELSVFPAYTVEEGDTCVEIAINFNVSVQSIIDANNLSESCILSAGETLTIPTTRLEGERGAISVRIYEKPDGRRRTSYTFITESTESYFELKGDNLEPLQKIANLPVKIWGEISANEAGMPFLTMEKFEILYPDLQFQVLRGAQETKELDGEEVILFTTGGITYIQLSPYGNQPDYNYVEDGGEVLLEVLQVPDETYAGYPALRVFMMGPAIDPTTGKSAELPRQANAMEVIPDPYGNADHFIPPDVTIEKIELIYFTNDPTYYDDTLDPAQVKLYLQPVWYYYGHNENGDEVNMYIQALRQEYLLPLPEP